MPPITLYVCPHDTVRGSEHWYRLVQYVNQQTNQTHVQVHFKLTLDFADFHDHMATGDLVYANPTDAIKLIDHAGFQALVRPTDRYDEALIVASNDHHAAQLHDIQASNLVAVRGLAPTSIALDLLAQEGIKPAQIIEKESWLGVISTVGQGDQPFGVIYRDTYRDLSDQGKAMVRPIAESHAQIAFHMLVASPHIAAQHTQLAELLLQMNNDPAGAAILHDLDIPAWQAIDPVLLTNLRHLFAKYP
ncbi:MAG: hypothetical protein Fur005_48170 [Roseiflexaceae bacterium]